MQKNTQPKQIQNKRAYHFYNIIETKNAGIQLTGSDVKFARHGRVGITNAFCTFINNELYINNMHIAEHVFGKTVTQTSHTQRKLLMKRRELDKWQKRITDKGTSIVPLKLFFADNGWLKAEIALVKGKREYDKRQTLKLTDTKREVDVEIKKRLTRQY